MLDGIEVHRLVGAAMKTQIGDLVTSQPLDSHRNRSHLPALAHARQVSSLADDGQAAGEDAEDTGAAGLRSHTDRFLWNLLLQDRLLPSRPRRCQTVPYGECLLYPMNAQVINRRPALPMPSLPQLGQCSARACQTGRALCSPFG